MRTLSVLALFAAGVIATSARAEDKGKKEVSLVGAYARKAGDLDLKMVFKKDNVMVYHVTIGDVGCVMTSKYKKKDGKYECEVTEFEKKGDFPATKDKGYKFSFKLEIKDKKVVLSDLEGDDINADQKQAAKKGCRIDPVPPVVSVSCRQRTNRLVEDFDERNVQHDASRKAG